MAYLTASSNNSKLISGIILTGTAVGSVKNNTLKVPLKKIKDLNLPIGIFHHIKDVCDNSHHKTAQKLQKKLKEINLGVTEFILIESGNLSKDTKCGTGKNHNFEDSRKELGEKVIKFIDQNS